MLKRTPSAMLFFAITVVLFLGCSDSTDSTNTTDDTTPTASENFIGESASPPEITQNDEENASAQSEVIPSKVDDTVSDDNSSSSPTVNITTRSIPNNSFMSSYSHAIPSNATIQNYDQRRFGIITGVIYADNGTTPLEGVKVIIKDHSEYGSVVSDATGRYEIATEASGVQIVDFYKTGYTPMQRRVDTKWNQIATTPKITMLAVDDKSTRIDLNSPVVQAHTSSTISDARGARSATIVFDGVRKATVVKKDGSSYTLSSLNVRATEFTTPESMPAALPPTSEFTYCIDVTIDGVDRDAMVYFDSNVSFFVENFLDAPVGTVVPVGYYNRNKAAWVSMKNGIVVNLLDSNGDGIIDGVDADNDGTADDINRDGSTIDEARGLSDNSRFSAGKSFTMFYSDHFTSIDSNHGPGANDDPDRPEDDDDCGSADSFNSYVNSGDQSFHEDVTIPGTPFTLWYNSKNTQGYHYQKIQPLSNKIGSFGTMVHFEVAGQQAARVFQDQDTLETTFYWDRKDYLGNVSTTPQIAKMIVDKRDITYRINYTDWQTLYNIDLFGIDMQAIENVEEFTPPYVYPRNSISSKAYSRSSTLPGIDQNTIANGWNFEGIYETINSVLFNKNNQYEVVFKGTYNMPDFIDKSGEKYELNYPATKIVVDDFGTIYRKKRSNSYPYYYYITQQKMGASEVTYLGGGTQNYSEGSTSFIDFQLSSSFDFTLDDYGNLIITDDNKIYKAYHDGRLVLFSGAEAGDAIGSYKEARFNGPKVPVVDKQGNIYVIDSGNQKIKKLDTMGNVTTVIEEGNGTHSGDYGLASEATMEEPTHLAIDSQNNLYIGFGNSDFYNSTAKQERIRVITPQGIIKPVAGELGGIAPWFNTTPVASNANMNYMQASFPLLVGPNDELYVGPYMIRKVSSNFPAFDEITQTYNHKQGNLLKIFDASFKHLKTIDLNTGITLYTFTHNDAGQLTTITDRYGQTTQIRYSGDRATSIIAPNGDETTFHVDENRNLTSITFPDGSTQKFEYNANDLMTAMMEPNGNRFVHEYNEHGRLISFQDDKGGEWNYESTRDANDRSRTLLQTTAEGSIRSQYFKLNANTTKTIFEVNAQGDEQTVTRSATSNTTTSCNTQTTTAPYGKEGRRNTLSYLESGGYSFGNYRYMYVSESILQDVEKHYADENDTQPQSMTYTQTLQMQPLQKYISSYYDISPLSRTSTQTIDYTTNTLTQTTPEGRTQSMRFNPLDMQPTRIESEGNYPVELSYNTKGDLLSTTQDERKSFYHYNPKGDLITFTDARGVPTYYSYDAMHRITSIKQEGVETHFSYDANGNLTSLSTPNNTTFETTHDAINYPETEISPLGSSTTYTYDRDRRLTKLTKPSGKSISYTYKGKRIESITTDTLTSTYSYGCGSQLESISTDNGETLHYSYDIYNRMTKQSYTGLLNEEIEFAYAPYQTSSYYYDPILGNALIYRLPTALTYAGKSQSFTYDMDGLLSSTADTTLTRDTQGRITNTSDTQGFKNTYSYNGYGERDEQVTTHNSNTLFTQKILKRDEGGRILTKFEQLKGHNAPTITNYTYDRNGRLTQVQVDSTITERYTYDDNANRLYEEINTTIGTYNQEDQLKSYGTTEYSYSTDGYLKTKTTPTGTTTYTYGIFGELQTITLEDNTLIEYKHNANHQRVAKLINGEIVKKYLWLNLTTLLATYDKDDNLITRYEYTSDRVPETMTHNKEIYHLLYNHQGSLRAVVDQEGTLIKELHYDSFGKITLDTNPDFEVDFGFAGGLYDKDTKLTRFGYRDYDAQTGKWTAKDPIGFNGGDTNLYGYVLQDPVNLVDPEGLEITLHLGTKNSIVNSIKNSGSIPSAIKDSVIPIAKTLDKTLHHQIDSKYNADVLLKIEDLDIDYKKKKINNFKINCIITF